MRTYTAALVAGIYTVTPALALAQDTVVDLGPAVTPVVDTAQSVAGTIVLTLVAWLVVVAKRFVSAAIVDMAAKRITAAALNAIGDGFDALEAAAAGGKLTVAVRSQFVADVVAYLVSQVGMWIRLAGMDKQKVEAFVEKLVGRAVNDRARMPLLIEGDVTPTGSTVTTRA